MTTQGGYNNFTNPLKNKCMKKLIQDFQNFETYEKIGVFFCLFYIAPALYCAIENIILNLL